MLGQVSTGVAPSSRDGHVHVAGDDAGGRVAGGDVPPARRGRRRSSPMPSRNGMPGRERRVVERDERRAPVAGGEVGVEARELLRAERAIVATGAAGVEREHADRAVVPGRRGNAARSVALSSWLPGSARTGAPSGASSSRTRAYSPGSPCSVRSPVTSTTSGAGPSSRARATARARSPSGSPSGADVRVAELEDHPASSSANARRTLRGARPVTTRRVAPPRARSKSRTMRSCAVCSSAISPNGKRPTATSERPRRPVRVGEDEPFGRTRSASSKRPGASPARCGAGPPPSPCRGRRRDATRR